ncbi:probable disease resistance protein At5g43740 [Olea europaea var. sylvestris]|uniref:probable disease resistance protein At5g43740 n=1 Tax=Olea europaea var. sylvestris TaxID=158386 RepID=UPI000C1D217C|nr:probable disease resistance protein At5g43740 [Olea europaea var. sylvestris]
MTTEVTELVEQSDFPRGIFVEVDESIDPLIMTAQHNGQEFLQNFDDIWASLMDDGVKRIGIYGMGRVAEITLALHVHDKLLKKSTFLGHVYWITVSQEFNIDKLQNDIAGVLKLDFSCIQGKKEICTYIGWCLEANRCREDCYSLRNEWMQKLGRVELHPKVERICKNIVKRCGGLPLAFVTLAGSMRGVIGIYEWRDALEGLEESCMGQANMEDKVLSILSYSYDHLGDEKLKNYFLRCTLYPKGYCIPIVKLIENFISKELMERRSSFRVEIDQGRAISNKLERPCLLERG